MAKQLLKDALKSAPNKTLDRDELITIVTQQLVDAGKKKKKAKALIAEKLELPIFASKGSKIVLVKKGAASESAPEPEPAKKRKAESEATPEKKNKKEKTIEVAISPSSSTNNSLHNGNGVSSAAAVRMMGPVEAEAFRTQHRIEVSGEHGDDGFRPVAVFADAGFSAPVLRATSKFSKPTPIQAQCWPIMMAGRDIIGVAETGSGKTLAFFLPAMMHLLGHGPNGGASNGYSSASYGKSKGPTILILAPTRELAMQTEDVCRDAGANADIKSICIYGGVPKGPQRQAINDGAKVVVATPGRLLDLHQEGGVELSGVSYLVLDEADRMLDMGFEKDVRSIIGLTNRVRRTVMFTATWPDSVRALASEFLERPVRVNVGSQELAANTRVTQTVEVIDEARKAQRLPQLLQKYHASRTNRVLIFALYKKECARLEQDINRAGWKGIAIHGDMTQAARTDALEQFKKGTVPLLVATDVAARGLDIPDVEVVINYTFPLTIEDYIHRIGRTGRGGKTGISHTLFTGSPQFEKPLAGALQNVLREAGQPVPDALLKFGSAVKKKEHKMYGAFSGGGNGAPMKAPTKIVFD